MLDTTHGLSLLTIMEIIGPIALAAAIVYGIYHSKRRRSQMPANRKGTVYEQEDSLCSI